MTEPPTHTPMIHGAIAAIIAELPAFGKDAEMEQGQRYRYRSIDSMLPHFKELFARHGVHVAPVYEVLVDSTITTRGGAEMTRAVVKGMFRFVSAEDGSSVACQTIGEARDAGDKAFNKAMTAAYKYALIQTFAVADADDPDHHRPELEGAPSIELPPGAEVRYPNFDALKALGPTIRAAGIGDDVKAFAGNLNIDMNPGHDEEGLAKVIAYANELLTEVLRHPGRVVTTNHGPDGNETRVVGPPPVPESPQRDVVAEAKAELDETLGRIVDEFGPGTEVVEP